MTCGLRELVLGEDPFETERLWYKMYRQNTYGGRRGVGFHAISGIDMALWDIKGKALGQPVWQLLGGGFHKNIRPYASGLGARLLRKPLIEQNGFETKDLRR